MRSFVFWLVLFTTGLAGTLPGQGCVAIRHFSSCSGSTLEDNQMSGGHWQLGMNYRYFKSFRHFRGTHEEPDRVANNTEVINHTHNWDLSINYAITGRWYAFGVIPLVLNTRSSLYEHGRSERNTTFSRGLGDIRLGTGYWWLDPTRMSNVNFATGISVKLPTGDYQATDLFYNVGPNGAQEVRPVDQSIQPGDGGFGVAFDLQFYYAISPAFSLFGSGFYLFNPRETNGVRTFRETLSPVLENEAIMSVPDQYGLRGGLSYSLPNSMMNLMLAARYEGIPVRDVIGGSAGFRRPGRVLSLEPGLSYHAGPWMLNLSVPIALLRDRPQSVTDKETEMNTGNPRNGDAAFADYLINVGINYRIGHQ